MSENQGLSTSSGPGPSTSNSSRTSNQQPLRFHSAHSSDMAISSDRSTAWLARNNCGAAFSDRPVRINEKIYLRYVNVEEAGLAPDLSVGFTIIDPAKSRSVPNILHPMIHYWITWLTCEHYEKDKILHYYVNGKGEVRYGVNGEEKGVILSDVNTSGPLWAAIQLFGRLREVKLVDPEASGYKRPNQIQVKDGVRRTNQNQVEDGVRRPNQIQVEDGVRRPNQIQVEDGVRRTNQNQVEDGVRTPNQSQVKNVPNNNFDDILRPSTSNISGKSNLQPLRFHSAHSDEIVISHDRYTAISTTLHSGATFSDRPVRINEKICLRCFNIKKRRPGVLIPNLTIGFTSVNPALAEWVPSMLNPMEPKYSEQNGYWMKWLRNLYYDKNVKLLHYYVNEKGEVHYGINGAELGVILTDVKISGPLWAVIQLFGGLREVKLVGSNTLDRVKGPKQIQVYDGVRRPNQSQVEDGVRRQNQSEVLDGVRRPNQSQVETDPLVNRISSISIDVSLPTPRYLNLVPLILHRTKSKNIKHIQSDGGIVTRLKAGSSKSYVFSAIPMRLGQIIVVQIIGTEQNSQGSLIIGLTSCDPRTLTPHELPNDLESLQDRPEYWVGYPANGLQIGDELDMTLTREGKMEIKSTSSIPAAVYHVDHTINLWAFINICGTTQTVKLLISSQNKKKPRKTQKRKEPQQNIKSEKIVNPSTSRQTLSECTICLEDQVDSVIYKCGHMCMCYNCAVKQWKGEGSASGRCPLCRGIITDVIRTFIP